ncbi:MAG: aminotransferase class I/II-fold pyridoxal phosphate-dependent enzyme [Christensenellales bacterium]
MNKGKIMEFCERAKSIVAAAEEKLKKQFEYVDEVAFVNQARVLQAFKNNNLGQRHFAPTNGYGYDDIGRDTLCKVFAELFDTDSAIVSPLIVSGTHALSLTLFGILAKGDKMLSVTGSPYDTLQTVIGGEGIGSLKDLGVEYGQVELNDGDFDYEGIRNALQTKTKLVFVGRSRGYEWRDALTVEQIGKLARFVKSIDSNTVVMCDNCYGEFIDKIEPTAVGVDVVAGSLIKNIGGGIAPTGGYICGRADLIDKIACRLTAPSIGMEVGSYAYGYKDFYQGLFMAPHTVAQAVKTSLLFGQVFCDAGYQTMPQPSAKCNDIIRSIRFDTEDELVAFVRSIQEVSPIDSNVVPYAWDMPGYEDKVIMAAGTFVAGASIELSADSPIKEPYIAYVQGGLTYQHGKLAVLYCLDKILNIKG